MLTHFEQAYKIKPIAGLLYNVAQCHRLLGNLEPAKRVYRAFINQSPESEQVAVAKVQLAEIERILEAQRSVKQSPPTSLGPTEASSAQSLIHKVPDGSPADNGTVTSKSPSQPTLVLSTRDPNSPPKTRSILSRSLIGAGLVAAGAGGYFAVQANHAQQDWHDATAEPAWSDARDRLGTNLTRANIGFVGGAAALLAGVALLVFTDSW